MLVHNSNEIVTSRLERDGTVAELWLAKSTGRLNVQIVEHVSQKSPTLVRLDGFYLVAEAILELGFSEEIMAYAYAVNKQTEGYMAPFETNVQAIISHGLWPLTVADQMAEAAQHMVGYFTGRKVTVGQMGRLERRDQGETDISVQVGDPWTETFELADDCVFCLEMTDEKVKDRVAGFQWALDKEVANRFGAGLGYPEEEPEQPPHHYSHDDKDAGRREYHDELKPWYADHPELLKVIPLIDLPLNLKVVLCIQWNHIVLEHLKVEPRFVRRHWDGQYFWMNVVEEKSDAHLNSILPSIKTRSNPKGRSMAPAFDMDLAAYGAWFGLS